MKNIYKGITIIALLITASLLACAQEHLPSKNKTQYKLKEIVILSRHNLRAPLKGGQKLIHKASPNQWVDFGTEPSYLTPKGEHLEVMVGQYFRHWLDSLRLFSNKDIPSAKTVYIYANSIERTIATANNFLAGFSPDASDIMVYHKLEEGHNDPLFHFALNQLTPEKEQIITQETLAYTKGKSLEEFTKSLQPEIELIYKVANIKHSDLYKEKGEAPFTNYNTQLVLRDGHGVHLHGSIGLASSLSDAMVLQYYTTPNDSIAGFGNRLTLEDWKHIADIVDQVRQLTSASITACRNGAGQMVNYIKQQLENNQLKLSFISGHDTNIATVLKALEVSPYVLPKTIEKYTPISAKVVFEKWEDIETHQLYIKVEMIYLSADQIRQAKPFTSGNQPMHYTLHFKNMKIDSNGMYPYDIMMKRLGFED